MRRNEGSDDAIFGAADADALDECRIRSSNIRESGNAIKGRDGIVLADGGVLPTPKSSVGIAVNDVQGVVLINIKVARFSKLFPFREELSFLVENLDAIVAAVSDKK